MAFAPRAAGPGQLGAGALAIGRPNPDATDDGHSGLARAARTLPIGTAYAIWVGIGAVGAAIGGVVLFDEAMPPLRAVFLALLVASIIGLKLTSTT